jgi:hypothetical protein
MSAVTVYVSGRPSEAHLVAGLLQANGVAAVVVNDHLITLQPFLSMALGGAQVQVPGSQAVEARQILDEHLGPAQGDLHTRAISAIELPIPTETTSAVVLASKRLPDGRLRCEACQHINELDSVYCEECGQFIKPEMG